MRYLCVLILVALTVVDVEAQCVGGSCAVGGSSVVSGSSGRSARRPFFRIFRFCR